MNNLIVCETCNHQISKDAKSCPNCGHLYPKNGKYYGFGVVFLIILAIAFARGFYLFNIA